MSEMTRGQIVDRARKLLRLGRSPNPHEGAAAKAKAADWIARHQVTPAELQHARLMDDPQYAEAVKAMDILETMAANAAAAMQAYNDIVRRSQEEMADIFARHNVTVREVKPRRARKTSKATGPKARG
jgi:Protein of unknown function (DUF2786)